MSNLGTRFQEKKTHLYHRSHCSRLLVNPVSNTLRTPAHRAACSTQCSFMLVSLVHKGLFCSKYRQSQLREKMSCFSLGSQGCVNRARRLERLRSRDVAVLSSCALLGSYAGKSARGASERAQGACSSLPPASSHPQCPPQGPARPLSGQAEQLSWLESARPRALEGVLAPGLVAPLRQSHCRTVLSRQFSLLLPTASPLSHQAAPSPRMLRL